jgi:hypothetical protein
MGIIRSLHSFGGGNASNSWFHRVVESGPTRRGQVGKALRHLIRHKDLQSDIGASFAQTNQVEVLWESYLRLADEKAAQIRQEESNPEPAGVSDVDPF